MRSAITLRIALIGTMSYLSLINDSIATGVSTACAGGADFAFSTSALTIRPCGPVPEIAERSSPASAAKRRASGLVNNLAPESVGVTSAGSDPGFELVPVRASMSARVILTRAPVPVTVDKSMPACSARRRANGVALAEAPLLTTGLAGTAAGTALTAVSIADALVSMELASSLSSSRKPITSFTATLSVPSGITIFPNVPESTASTSIVALSVSISARTSPGSTLSPSPLCHLARLPSVMVGESAGIRILIGIS